MRIFLLSCLLILSGCSLLQPVNMPTIHTYQLGKVTELPSTHNKTSLVLLVAKPIANEAYQTQDMQYSEQNYQIQTFAKNQWAAPPASMLLPQMVSQIRNKHYFRAVVPPPYPGRSDLVLTTQLHQFQQYFSDDSSYFQVTLTATLIRSATAKAIAQQRFSVIAYAPEPTPYGGVLAANEATQKVLQQLASWVVRKSR